MTPGNRSRLHAFPRAFSLGAVALALTIGLSAIACSSATRKSHGPQPTAAESSADPGGPLGGQWQLKRKEDIRVAWDRITELRLDPRLGLSREPSVPLSDATSLKELRECTRAPQEPEVSESCTDVCTIKDAICDNAEDICRIAAELEGDVWADGKCASGKASCKEAKEVCCGCVQPE